MHTTWKCQAMPWVFLELWTHLFPFVNVALTKCYQNSNTVLCTAFLAPSYCAPGILCMDCVKPTKFETSDWLLDNVRSFHIERMWKTWRSPELNRCQNSGNSLPRLHWHMEKQESKGTTPFLPFVVYFLLLEIWAIYLIRQIKIENALRNVWRRRRKQA